MNHASRSLVGALLPRRLAPRSVEKLFTAAVATCKEESAGVLKALVLHVHSGEAAGLPYCDVTSDEVGTSFTSRFPLVSSGAHMDGTQSSDSARPKDSPHRSTNFRKGAMTGEREVGSNSNLREARWHGEEMGGLKIFDAQADIDTQEERAPAAKMTRAKAVHLLPRERGDHSVVEKLTVGRADSSDIRAAKAQLTAAHGTELVPLPELTAHEQLAAVALLSSLVLLALVALPLQFAGLSIFRPILGGAALVALVASTFLGIVSVLCRGGFTAACSLEWGISAIGAVVEWCLSWSWQLLLAAIAAIGRPTCLLFLLGVATWLCASLIWQMRAPASVWQHVVTATSHIQMLKVELPRVNGGFLRYESRAKKADALALAIQTEQRVDAAHVSTATMEASVQGRGAAECNSGDTMGSRCAVTSG